MIIYSSPQFSLDFDGTYLSLKRDNLKPVDQEGVKAWRKFNRNKSWWCTLHQGDVADRRRHVTLMCNGKTELTKMAWPKGYYYKLGALVWLDWIEDGKWPGWEHKLHNLRVCIEHDLHNKALNLWAPGENQYGPIPAARANSVGH